ncbi:30S ribosome-binding factor RbfA [Bdellovibrio bacteriovorus]|uniref:Ribosome-binding factor A n=1 Tax=Bdellovibrio bacteriovorus TaxID=959 RepID=A0A150WBG2_BDEBC|nr:30S ribosome-binding factor RbfA [Bdellovibrio bacteriovorus]KYG60364.1 ribosome-binding factor A [Bdellovibrio bacteriovorus]KYG64302.1 ribosome-binding factor A [Bdellovibrio bacteriovorus]
MKNMGDGRRVARVEREIQATIAQFLLRGFKSPLPGLVTVASVKMPADLRAAKVYISVLGSDAQKTEALELLQERAFEIQNFIGKELKMRYCPKLTFYADHATDQVLKVEKILHELELERKAKGETSDDESDDE